MTAVTTDEVAKEETGESVAKGHEGRTSVEVGGPTVEGTEVESGGGVTEVLVEEAIEDTEGVVEWIVEVTIEETEVVEGVVELATLVDEKAAETGEETHLARVPAELLGLQDWVGWWSTNLRENTLPDPVP